MNKRDFPIGTTLIYKGIRLQVVRTQCNTPVCNKCYFSNKVRKDKGIGTGFPCYKLPMTCIAHLRKDKQSVIFKEIETT